MKDVKLWSGGRGRRGSEEGYSWGANLQIISIVYKCICYYKCIDCQRQIIVTLSVIHKARGVDIWNLSCKTGHLGPMVFFLVSD